MSWFLQHQIDTLVNSRYVKDNDVVPLPAETTLLIEITINGVTFNLNRYMPVCFSCLGEPVVISTEDFFITSITPISASIPNYTGSSTSTVGNGAMLNPTGINLATKQGFDKLIEDNVEYELFPESGTTEYYNTTYDAASNIDPAINGNIYFQRNSVGSVVKSVRATDTSGQRIIEKYAVLTVLKDIPPNGFFRPPVAGTVKEYKDIWTESRINYNILRDIEPLNDQITLESAEEIIKPFVPSFGISAKKLRSFNVFVNNSDVKAVALNKLDAISLLHNDIPKSDKRILLLRLVQHGIDVYGEYLHGYTGNTKYDYEYGRSIDMYFAGFSLRDNDILNVAKTQKGATLNQHAWITADDVGSYVRYPSDEKYDYVNKFTYESTDIGVPEWFPEPGVNRERDSSLFVKYRNSYQIGMMEMLNIGLLVNGPNGITGTMAMLNNGSYNSSNSYAAPLAYYDRMSKYPESFLTVNYLQINGRGQQWSSRRNLLNMAIWLGRPDVIDKTDTIVQGGDGSIIYDTSGIVFTNDPVTSVDLKYSIDNISWIQLNSVPLLGSITDLTRGLSHEVSFRFHNTSGISKWTTNAPKTSSSGSKPLRRNKVSVTGSGPADNPSPYLPPSIFNNRFDSVQELYDTTDSSVTTTFMDRSRRVLFAGIGYWSGYPAPTFTLQWRADEINIPGQTNNSLELDWYKYSGKSIDCVITPFGSSDVITNKVIIPVEVEPTAPTTFTRIKNYLGSSVGYFLQRSTKFENIVNGTKGTIAIKGKLIGAGTDTKFITIGNGTVATDILRLETDSTGKVKFTVRNASGTILANTITTTNLLNTTGEFVLLVTWDVANNLLKVYLNGTDITVAPSIVNDIIPYDSAVKNTILSSGSEENATQMELDYIYFNAAETIDLTVAGNRAKFSVASDMGAWGKGPTGNRPILFLSGKASRYNLKSSNRGIGNQLVVKGAAGVLTPAFYNVT